MRRVRVLVGGEVQGVGYRYTLQHVAQGAGVTGWVRNLRDGRVEAELEGADAAVAAVLDWMGTGPRGGRVTSVEQDDVTPTGDAGFEIRRDG
ncbi:MAG: acylphosphatase [Microbacterium sp. SCN 70-27]|uniref:acylphosphatase n=1 Tax=unclassified Microbacterium TaxID=2609290 RepID=UPI00086C8EB5|nr:MULTISPECIES: acylphosphatase [unclassified Microbacterium]MBN9224003.1 acylphosphatase [Microbacterium sp.]ODT26327.1 MAG: acylphosphatase [Microbacterium sp. SCN 70-27]